MTVNGSSKSVSLQFAHANHGSCKLLCSGGSVAEQAIGADDRRQTVHMQDVVDGGAYSDCRHALIVSSERGSEPAGEQAGDSLLGRARPAPFSG